MLTRAIKAHRNRIWNAQDVSGGRTRTPPFRPQGSSKSKGSRHCVVDCTHATDAQNSKYLSDIAANKAKMEPSKSTRSQLDGSGENTRFTDCSRGKLTTGRMPLLEGSGTPIHRFCPAFTAMVSDGCVSLPTTKRCDHGSDDSIVSPALAEKPPSPESEKARS